MKSYKFFEQSNSFDASKSIKTNDKIIMSSESNITPKSIKQVKDLQVGFKPKGLWYAFNTQWIDWVDVNMPDWKEENIHKIELNYNHILRLGIDMKQKDFEDKYGINGFGTNSGSYKNIVTGIDWEQVEKDGWYGIEIENPFGKIGTWIRQWDISSGCIWDKRAIKKITNISHG